jgi:serine/threonine protein kinase
LNEFSQEPTDFDDISEPDYIEAESVEEFVHKTNISDKDILDRVLLPGRLFGPYRILGFIAAGGMGEIYAARQNDENGDRGRPIALKVINPEHCDDWRIIERFKREASISRAIRSPNVIRVFEYGQADGKQSYLSMELLRGEELFERLCRVRTLPLDDLADLTLQVLRGLGDIHRGGFIHRDVKPENIFLAKQPGGHEVVKILDFGIAKRRDERSDPLLSVAGQIYGTPEYLAPEQANHPDVDLRADLYSVGVMLYEATTGSLPFKGDTSYSVIAAHQNEPVPPLPSSVDPAFAEIIYTALAKRPDDRFQTADEMAGVIERWRDQTSWVEELPGGSALAFDDVFDSQDLVPTAGASRRKTSKQREKQSPIGLEELSDPQFYLDEDSSADGHSGALAFEKISVSKARERRQNRRNHGRSGSEPASRTQSKKRSAADRTAELDQALPSMPLIPPADEPTVTRPRKNLDVARPASRGARLARVVTWLAVIIIVAAIAWAFYTPTGADEASGSPADPAAAAPVDPPR